MIHSMIYFLHLAHGLKRKLQLHHVSRRIGKRQVYAAMIQDSGLAEGPGVLQMARKSLMKPG